jgi:isopenicillin-N N-acyltransferase-like protein
MRVGSIQTVPHIRISGSAEARGYELGREASDRIAKSLANYAETFDHYTGLPWDEICGRADAFLPAIEEYDYEIADEMRGIARGAGVDLREILALNVRTEVMYGVSANIKAECTAFATEKGLSAVGHVMIGQNWDWRPVCREACILLEVEQPDKPSFITFLEAGLVGKMGLNSAGIGLVTNLLITDRDRGEVGVPFHVVLRGILNSTSLQDARRAVTRARRAASANYLIADRDGEMINLETEPGWEETVYSSLPGDGVLTHANCFLTGLESIRDVGMEKLPDSRARTDRLRQLLAAGGVLDIGEIEAALVDHSGHPDSICRHTNEQEHPIEQIATNASLIMDLTTSEMRIAVGPPCEGSYDRVTPKFARELQPS